MFLSVSGKNIRWQEYESQIPFIARIKLCLFTNRAFSSRALYTDRETFDGDFFSESSAL